MSLSLVEYAKRRKRSLYAIGKAAGLPEGQIYHIASGRRGCGTDTIEAIKLATDGEVTANELHKTRLSWLRARRARDAAKGAHADEDDREPCEAA